MYTSTAEKTAWTGDREGKKNAELHGHDLSMGSQALETLWAGPFRVHCATWDSSLYRFSAPRAYGHSNFFLWKSLPEFSSAFGAQLGLWAVCKRLIQTLKLEPKESVGVRYFIWISFFPSSQHSCWEVKPSILIDIVCLTQSFRTANIHFTR